MIQGRRSFGLGLAGFACVVLSAHLAAADDDDLGPRNKGLSVGVTAGVFIPDADVHDFYFAPANEWQPLNQVGPAMGLRVSYDLIRYVGIELEGEVTPIGIDTTGDAATLLGWRAHVIGQLPGRLTPFVLLGGGSIGVFSRDEVLGDDNDLTQHLGAGAKFYITPQLSVRLDGRWLLAPKWDVLTTDGDTVSHFLITSSLSWTFNGASPVRRARPDPDRDGVIGDADQCPQDSGVAPDGCPAVADRDNDGILGAADRCPDVPETLNEVDDLDGCPDKVLDQDGDGLSQRVDACPNEAEDVDGFRDHDGCPEADNDSDEIPDPKDSCPLVAGPPDNRGCPDKDSDGDSVVDRFDNCPAETGSAQNHGCRSKQLVAIAQAEIKILDNVYFATGRAAIRARSNPLLNNLARVLNAHPEITRVVVEGHTDGQGDAAYNQELSQRRARAVVEHLEGKGVSANRMEAIGRGEENPLADNGTSRGRLQNRRVEFRIERSAAPTAMSR